MQRELRDGNSQPEDLSWPHDQDEGLWNADEMGFTTICGWVRKRKARRLVGVTQNTLRLTSLTNVDSVYWLSILPEKTLKTIAQSVTSICVQIYSPSILFGYSVRRKLASQNVH